MSTPSKLIVPEEARALPVPTSEAGALLSMIATASRDSSVDVEKMKQLFALRKQITDEQNEAAFNIAMSQAQSEMGRISSDAENLQTHSKYATYGKLDKALRPIYTRHGFALSFNEGETPKPDHVRVLAYVSHSQGFSRTYFRDIPADGKGAKGGDVMTKTHAVGAAQSYGMRYLLKAIFNVAVGEEDTDGNDDVKEDLITEQQVKEIEKLITDAQVKSDAFLGYYKIATVADIRAGAYETIRKVLEAKAVKRKKP